MAEAATKIHAVHEDVVWHDNHVSREQRWALKGQQGVVMWLTGLSGSGKDGAFCKATLAALLKETSDSKRSERFLSEVSFRSASTVSNALDAKLTAQGRHTYVLDGDNVRHGLNRGLGFSAEDRKENVRRVGEVARLMVDLGIIVLVPVIRFNDGEFVEVHVSTSLQTCEERDPKDLYKKARAGEITNMTGIGSPYEEPLSPEIVLEAEGCSVEQCADKLLAYLREGGYLQPPRPKSIGDSDSTPSGAFATES